MGNTVGANAPTNGNSLDRGMIDGLDQNGHPMQGNLAGVRRHYQDCLQRTGVILLRS